VRRRLHGLLKLRSPSDALLLARIVAFAAVAPFLARLGLEKLQRLLTPPVPAGRVKPDQVDRIVRYVDAVCALGRPVIDQGCLTRGLTLYYFLRRAALDVALCFGVGYPDGRFAGHCWLERDGEPFLEPRDPRLRYTEMYRFPSGRSGAPLPWRNRQGLPG